MNAKEFLWLVVKPNVEELEADCSDLRKAYNAVAAVDSLAAHIFVELRDLMCSEVAGCKDDTQYREALSSSIKDFGLIRDLAKAQKHVRLSRGKPEVTEARQMSRRSLGWGEARWGEGRWGSPPQAVVVTNDCQYRVLEVVLRNCLEALEHKMKENGIA